MFFFKKIAAFGITLQILVEKKEMKKKFMCNNMPRENTRGNIGQYFLVELMYDDVSKIILILLFKLNCNTLM